MTRPGTETTSEPGKERPSGEKAVRPSAHIEERTVSGVQERSGLDVSLGNVLRSAYEEMVEEAVPDELLDLLRKLD